MSSPRAASQTVYTVGHSNHALPTFVDLLGRHGIAAVADVRSAPHSRFNPQFNRGTLTVELRRQGIEYVYLGRELGGRSEDPACYENGRIRYDRVAETDLFGQGLVRLLARASANRIAMVCAEKEPLDCHRTLLVAHALDGQRIDVAHIHADGELERHASAMDRLLALFDMHPEDDLLRRLQPRAELIAEAVARQASRVAHVNEDFLGNQEGEPR